MTTRLDRPATREGLFLWIMHRFAEVFEGHAVLKRGMALRRIMSRGELAADLRGAVAHLSDDDCRRELSGILPADELAGLALRIRATVVKLADGLEHR